MKTARPFEGRILLLGYGCVGAPLLPLLPKALGTTFSKITIIEADDNTARAQRYVDQGATYIPNTLIQKGNLKDYVLQHMGRGGLLLNMTSMVDSHAVITLCGELKALYVDTAWTMPPDDLAQIDDVNSGHVPSWEFSSYDHVAATTFVRSTGRAKGTPTAIVDNGSNPGMVNHFVKAALVDITERTGQLKEIPKTRDEWAALAEKSGTRVIQICENDTQISHPRRRPGEFLATWSPEQYWWETVRLCSEVAWGTHERVLPEFSEIMSFGSTNGLLIKRPAALVRTRSWLPLAGEIWGYTVAHPECHMIQAQLACVDTELNGYTGARPNRIRYAPTVSYSYQPAPDAVLAVNEFLPKFGLPNKWRPIMEDVVEGSNELGVLLLGHQLNGWWYGSHLTLEEARSIAPEANATSIAVVAGALASAIWVVDHPNEGILEPDDLPYDEMMANARHLLGTMSSVHTDWTPLKNRWKGFEGPVGRGDDIWQFQNFMV